MSLFLEACEICKNESKETLAEFMNNYPIDIHEKDNLLLLIAAQNGKIDTVNYLIEKGANIHAQNGKWFYFIFTELDLEKCAHYLDLNVCWDDPLNQNLFDFVNISVYKKIESHFKLLIDKLYPMPLSTFRFLNFEQYEYLKNSGNLEIYQKQLFNFAKQTPESDSLYDLSKNKLQINDASDMMQVLVYKYEKYPYVLDDESEKKLKNKEFKMLDELPKTLSLLKKIKNNYPDYVNYAIKNTSLMNLHNVDMDYLKELFENPSLKPIIEAYYKDENFDLDKVRYLAKHAILPTQFFIDVLVYNQDNHLFNDLLELIHENKAFDVDYQEKLKRFAINAHLFEFTDLNQLHEKNNITDSDIDFIQACKEGNFDNAKLAIENGANVNCDGNIGFYKSLEKDNTELIQLMISHTQVSNYTLKMALVTENKFAIMYLLNIGIQINQDNLEIISSLSNQTLSQEILNHPDYKEHFIHLMEENYFYSRDYEKYMSLATRQFYLEHIDCNQATTHLLQNLIKTSFFLDDISNEIIINKMNVCEKFKAIKPYYFHHHLNQILQNKNYELFDYLVSQDKVIFDSDLAANAVVVKLDYNNAAYLVDKFKNNEQQLPLVLDLVLKNSHIDLFDSHAKLEEHDYIALLKHSNRQKSSSLNDMAINYILDKIIQYQPTRLSEIEDFALEQASDLSKKLIFQLNTMKEKELLTEKLNANLNDETTQVVKKKKKI